MKLFICLIFLMGFNNCFAKRTIEFVAGVSYTAFDDYSEYDDYGVSAKIRYHWFGFKDNGIFISGDFPASPFYMVNLFGGYGFRTGGPIFFEVGAGAYYGMIWGTGVGVVFGTGYKNGNWYISLPVTYKSGISLEVTPLIGYSF